MKDGVESVPIKKGDKVKVDFTGKLEDGTVFDTSEGREPFEFEVGSGQFIKGFSEAVIGLEIGEEKEVTIEPPEAYGEIDPDLQKIVAREKLPKEREPILNMILELRTNDGISISGRIVEITDKDVTIDLNHPLAGKTLIFQIKVIEIS